MHPQTERRVISFINTIARDCTMCLRRCDENCRTCRSLWANSILTDIEADRDGISKHIDYSMGARTEKILLILRQAKKPLTAREINLEGLCSFQLKRWTLHKLIRRGLLGKMMQKHPYGRSKYLYFLKSRKETNNANEKKDYSGRK